MYIYTYIYIYIYIYIHMHNIHAPRNTQTYINTDTHMQTYTLFIIQVR